MSLFSKLRLRLLPTASLIACSLAAAYAQNGYQVSEDYQPDPATADAGPVRMARISFVQGDVSFRPAPDGDWAPVSPNLPLRQGSQLWINDRSRAEIQFDDGSVARIGSTVGADGAVVTLQTLYSDSKGEFTELALSSGLISLRLTNSHSLYQVDTSALSAKAYGPAKFRVGIGRGVEVVNRTGEVSVQNNATSSLILQPGEDTFGPDTDTLLQSTNAPMEDGFDHFVDTRDGVIFAPVQNVPPNIAVCAGGINGSGTWRSTSYGEVWCPSVAPGWAPYHYGHWVFVRPFGWTWCSDESWGWAPYHYGTWVSTSYGWAWVPGPAQQCWSPAVVNFTSYNGQVAWCALAPSEVHYAAVGVGINLGGGVSLGFSIGSVGCYYPAPNNQYCVPQTFNNVQVNRVTTVTNITTINNYYGSTAASTTGFVPQNAAHNGAAVVPANGFGQANTLPQNLGKNGTTVFQRGQSFSGAGGRVLSGPPGVQVSHESFTPTHAYAPRAPSAAVLSRPIVRPALPPAISHVSAPAPAHVVEPPARNGNVARPPVGVARPPVNANRPGQTSPNRTNNPGFGSTRPESTVSRPPTPPRTQPSQPARPSTTPPARSPDTNRPGATPAATNRPTAPPSHPAPPPSHPAPASHPAPPAHPNAPKSTPPPKQNKPSDNKDKDKDKGHGGA